jgi:hypothetical protein
MSQEKDKEAGKQSPKRQPAPSKKAAIDNTTGDRINELSSLHMLFRRSSTGISVDNVIATALNEIITIIDPDLCSLYLQQGDQLVLKDRSQKNGKAGLLLPKVTHKGECLCRLAASTTTPVYSKNIHTDP